MWSVHYSAFSRLAVLSDRCATIGVQQLVCTVWCATIEFMFSLQCAVFILSDVECASSVPNWW